MEYLGILDSCEVVHVRYNLLAKDHEIFGKKDQKELG
jgi:hypothetical protein